MDSNVFSNVFLEAEIFNGTQAHGREALGRELWQRPDGEPAIKDYHSMTETEKEHLILRCKDAKNLEQKKKAMEELAPSMDLKALEAETGMFGGYEDGGR